MKFEIETPEKPFEDFKRIADSLMNEHVLIAGDNRYRLIDLEFYHLNEAEHNDM